MNAFLERHANSSLFLRSNLDAAGLVNDGTPASGAYAGWWVEGALVGVVSHAWNNVLLLQAPAHAGPLARWLAQHTGRPVNGMCGSLEQLRAARTALDLLQGVTDLDSEEDLFALELHGLRMPPAAPHLNFRRTRASDMPRLAAWRAAFQRHEMGPGAVVDAKDVLRQTERAHVGGRAFVLEAYAQPVAMCSYSARIPDCVQLGGVWTQPEARQRGYGRAVVAGALGAARDAGITRGVLFTPRTNAAAQALYRSLGFACVGDYGLVRWRTPQVIGS